MSRLVTGFRNGTGLASPALIVVWLAVGAGLIWLQWTMSASGITAYSGRVQRVSVDPKFGMHVAIDSTSVDFFFDSGDYPQLPDIRVGDHVDILTDPSPEGWSVAVQSQRGTWIDTIFGDEVAPFTPQTWPLHEVLRWSALGAGILVALFGGACLVRWIPSADKQPASSGQAPASDPGSIEESAGAATRAEAPQSMDVSDAPVEEASPPLSATSSDRAETGVLIGGITVSVLPILEVIGMISALGSCAGVGFSDVLLIAITIALAVGGASTLILASNGQSASPQRAVARRLGIVAVVMAVVSVPVNGFLVLLTGFCGVGNFVAPMVAAATLAPIALLIIWVVARAHRT